MYSKRTPLSDFNVIDSDNLIVIENTIAFTLYLLVRYCKANNASINNVLQRGWLSENGKDFDEYNFLGLVAITNIDGFPIFKFNTNFQYKLDGLKVLNEVAAESLLEGKVDEVITLFDTGTFVLCENVNGTYTSTQVKLLNLNLSNLYFQTPDNVIQNNIYDPHCREPNFWDDTIKEIAHMLDQYGW